MAHRIALLGTVLWCAALLAGCVAVQPKPDGSFSVSLFPPSSVEVTGSTRVTGSSTGASSSTPTTGTGSGPALPGATLISGPWKVQVERTDEPKSLPDGSRPHGGKRFVVVNVAINNVGMSAALIVRPEQFKLKDTHGVTIRPFPTSLSAFNAREVRPIEAGMGGYTEFVYEVPAGSSEYGFIVTPKQGATNSMSWIVP